MGSGGNLACNISQPGPFPVTMEWNGLTNLLTAEKRGLTAGGTYTLKIAVADVFDAEYDSGVIFDIISGVYGRDYGDAPNAGGYGNPYHEVKSTLRLGPSVTTEVNSLANATASGDADNGLTIPVLTELSATTIDVNATGGAGYLQAWFDWNDDGDFADAGEQVATNAQDTNGDGWIPLTVTPPATASAYSTFARFRWSTATGVTATANAIDGEIEDYPVDINPASTTFSCPAGMVPIAQNGDAVSVLGATSVSNPALALGAILASGAATTNANSASMSSSGAALSLDLGFTIPQNAPLILSVARDNNSGVIAIDTSPDGTTWTQQTTFNLGPNDLAQHVTINNPGGAVRYVRFRRTGGSVWIDGVQYSNICAGVSSMAGSKSISIYNPTGTTPYALPGSDVIYAITVTNTGANAADSDSVLVIDRVPSEVEVFTGTTPEFGGQVAGFTQTGTPTLTFNPATDLAWSASATRPANYAACNHTAATGYDPAITYVCFNPKGIFQSGDPDPNFTVSLRARIK
jgi:uncharacterized repeat protein (TIGR01451 family)